MKAGHSIPLLPITILIGLSGIIGQLLLLRELLIVFYGNELTMGLILSNWLLAEALGAFLGGHKYFHKKPLGPYILFLFLYALLLPVTLYLVRSLPWTLFGPMYGEALGLGPAFFTSLLLLTPISLVHGALFPLATSLYTGPSAIGKIYLVETMGTLLGALFFTLYAAQHLTPMAMGLILTALHLGATVLLLQQYLKRKLFLSTLIIIFFILLFFLPKTADYLHELSLSKQWPQHNILHWENTPYGNLMLCEARNQYTYYYDGKPLFTTPNPDLAPIQEFIHLSGSLHPQPATVLLLGGGLGGTLNELLRHPVQNAVYVELDPSLVSTAQAFPTPLTEKELNDERVFIETTDARRYVAGTNQTYDLILIGSITPETLQTNRLFTAEFFQYTQAILHREGLLVFSMPGSSRYVCQEMASLHASIYNTLQATFPHVAVIPHDQTIYIASQATISLNPSLLESRLQDRHLHGEVWSLAYLKHRLNPLIQEQFLSILHEEPVEINRDFFPISFYHALSLWGRAFSPTSSSILNFFTLIQPLHYVVALVLLFVGLHIFFVFKPQASVLYALGSTGGISMGLDLLLLFLFQCLYGYVYQMAGLLMAAFMLGMCSGAHMALGWKQQPLKPFLTLEALIIVSLSLFYALAMFLQKFSAALPHTLLLFIIILYAFLTGGLLGAEFPLASALYSKGTKGRRAGILYGIDLLGGYAGGLAISFVLFPLLGLGGTLLIMGGLKCISFFGLTTRRRMLAHD